MTKPTLRNFKNFNAAVDEELAKHLSGMTSEEMPDASWRDYFDDELTPKEAIEAACEDYWMDDGFGQILLDALESK